MKKKTVLWILLILAVLFGIDRWVKRDKTDFFDTTLIHIDTSGIDAINISFPAEDYPLIFVREANTWIVSQGYLSVKAKPGSMEHLLSYLARIRVEKIISDVPGQWLEYGVGKDQGVRVEVFANQEKLEDFILGMMVSPAGKGGAADYIRLFDQKEIYAVKRDQATFSLPAFGYYRSKQFLLWPDIGAVGEISLQTPDTTFVLSASSGTWKQGDDFTLDSMGMVHYLNGLKDLSSENFADDFDETKGNELLFKRLVFKGNTGAVPLTINCYRDTTREKMFILYSGYNPESWFESDAEGLYKTVFSKLEQLLNNGHNDVLKIYQ